MGVAPSTEQGLATRARIVRGAADLILDRGAQGTTLDQIRGATQTSKSQLFHYFPGGKRELVDAVAMFQSDRTLDAQRPFLDQLDTWESWEGWRTAVLAHYASQPCLGCPIGALSAELARSDPEHAAAVVARMEHWRGYLEAGIARMVEAELLQPDTDPGQLSCAVFASLHGGLALMAIFDSVDALRAGLDAGMAALRASAS